MTSPSAPTQPEEVVVRFGAWHGDAELRLCFPDGWRVRCLNPTDAPAMTGAEIEESYDRPVGSSDLCSLASGKHRITIAVEDLTRPAPLHDILPPLLERIDRSGISAERVCILVGTGAHRPMNAQEIRRKLGATVADRCRVVMHDFMGEDIRWVGWVHGGPVYLNRHFVEADLRICVGSVIPHAEAGFGGGAKMVVPGVAGRLSIAHLHGARPPRPAGQIEADRCALDRRGWAEAVARHIGVDLAVCAVVNSRRQLAGLYVGDLVAAHRCAAERAVQVGRTLVPRELMDWADVVVVNAYPLDTDPIQMGKSINTARKLSPRQTVVINAASDGVFYHGMGMGCGLDFRRLLRNVPGWLASPTSQWATLRGLLQTVRQPLLAARSCYFSLNHLSFAAYAARQERTDDGGSDAVLEGDSADPILFSKAFPPSGFKRRYPRGRLCNDWEDVRGVLSRRFPAGRALVFPCAPLQIVELG